MPILLEVEITGPIGTNCSESAITLGVNAVTLDNIFFMIEE